VSESNGKLQDELAALFDRQMTMTQPESSSVAYNVSQHYHHSAHVASIEPSPTVRTQPVTTSSISYILASYGIDSRTLSPSQLDLFQNADIEQRQRLIQTWQLYLNSAVESTSMPHSALPARDSEMKDCSSDGGDDQKGHAEPYMISGYEATSQRNLKPPRREPTTGEPYVSSTDPVYRNQQWWEAAPVGMMEPQYWGFEERNR
jgi:hypothetical protein